MSPSEHWMEVDGGRLYAERRGAGPPLLLLHGWPLDHRMFGPQLDGLAGEFTIIAPDRRGFGRSTAPPDLTREVDDIDSVLDEFGLKDVHLLGMSQGGRIALRYAAQRGERLRSLILQGAVVDGLAVEEPEAERIPLEEYAALARAGLFEELRRRWLSHPMMRLDPDRIATARLLREVMSAYEGADLLRAPTPDRGATVEPLEALADFDKPTLILTGRRETFARKAHAAALVEAMPDVREVFLEHSGHLSNLTEPEAYNEALRRFCRAVEAGRS